jgi:membrane-anchored protein YejM (alkaline phosphatase superfamily)
MLVRGPGFAAGSEVEATSHLDIPATLLEALGAHAGVRAHWTLGGNLLTPIPDRKRVISGWNELGLWTYDGIIRVPLSLLEFDVELYDYRWQIIHDDLSVLQAERETLEQLGAECNRFLR